MGPLEKMRLYAWGLAQAWKLGRPDVALGFFGSIGDDLLCTAAIHEWLERDARRIWFFTRHPALYSHYDRRVRRVPEDARLQRLARRLGQPMRPLSYSQFDPVTDRDSPVAEHLITVMCRHAGLTGRIALRPHLTLTPAELAAAAPFAGQVVVQTSSLSAALPMRNKQWRTDRLQEVVDRLAGPIRFVQIGSPADPALRGVTDLRGRTSLRESAAVLAQARLFIGLVGFLMHLARAVECPAVIVYGGREPPELTGYSCNTNLTERPACAPCWQRNRCDFGRICLEQISSSAVLAATEDLLSRARHPLAVDYAEL